jgi:hypothetical protein
LGQGEKERTLVPTWLLYAILSALAASLVGIFGKLGVAKIDESDEDEIDLDAGDEKAPEDGAVVEESELDRSVDPEPGA